MDKKVVRYFIYGVGIFFAAALVLVAGIVFVFGEDVLDVFGIPDSFGGESYGDSEGIPRENNANDSFAPESSSSGGGGGGGGSGGGGGGGGSSLVCLEYDPVQYSIGDFDVNIECLLYGIEGCERIRMTCGSEISNLDYYVGGIFAVRYSLFSGKEEIDFEIVEENIAPRGKVNMNSEVIVDGVFDVDSLECVVNSEDIPLACSKWG